MWSSVVAMVFPLSCPACGVVAEPVCGECARGLRPAPILAPPVGVDAWFAAFEYEGVARELVARVKYRRAHAVTAWLAEAMAALVPSPIPTVVTWAPTTPQRRRERGFDHAELLARRVGHGLGVPVRSLLARTGGPAQTGLSAAERRIGPCYRARRVTDAEVLVIDDVATSGATLAAAASALRSAGASRVMAVTAARTSLTSCGGERPSTARRTPS